jgi:hypothetical protein
MINVDLDRLLKMPCVQHQKPVQTFGSNSPHEPFRDPVRLRSLNRRPNTAHILGLIDGVEAARELGIAVANQKPNRLLLVDKHAGDLPRPLRHHTLSGCAVQPAKCKRWLPSSMKNSTLHSLEPNGVDGEEIHRDDAVGLRTEGLSP